MILLDHRIKRPYVHLQLQTPETKFDIFQGETILPSVETPPPSAYS